MGTWPKIRPVRIRAISMDVTGTLVSFRGSLSQHYLGSAEKCGIELPDTILPIGPAFGQAYREVSLSTCYYYGVGIRTVCESAESRCIQIATHKNAVPAYREPYLSYL